MDQELLNLVNSDDIKLLKALYSFNDSNDNETVIFKFNLWSRKYFHKYFTSDDAPFHKELDLYNLQVYRGEITSFVDIAFRGAAKTARTKLFMAFCIANDMDHFRKYIKVLAEDGKNSKQIVTDVYNMLITPDIHKVWPEVFSKTKYKREETMSSFTTSTGVKMTAGTVGTDQRGNIQDEARPDFIWFEDFENRKSLRSAVTTKSIFDNMEEARTGLALGGSCLYTCNYISERGNVHKLVQKHDGVRNIVLIIPIIDKIGVIAWDRYSKEAIDQMRIDDDDFEGERLCEPSAGADVLFNRENLNKMPVAQPIKIIGEDLKIFHKYDPGHRYAIGSDVAMGVGLDSSTAVCIDFDVYPCRVVATYHCNTIKPDSFGLELISQGERYGECLVAPENNPGGGGHSTIQIMKQQNYPNIFTIQPKDTSVDEREKNTVYGWNTNPATKPKMFMALRKAVDDGHLLLEDEDLIKETKSYSRDDLMDKDEDPRLVTRHMDLITACFVKSTMVLTNKGQQPIETIKIGDLVMTRNGYKKVISSISHLKKVITNIGLTGTIDHPVFCNNNEIKDLSGINHSDILYIWDSKAQKIERLSYIMAQNIIGIQTQKHDVIEFISEEELSGKKKLYIYIDKFGLIISEIFQKVLLFIIRIVTHLIMIFQIFRCYHLKNIWNYMLQKKGEKINSEKISRKIELKLIKEYYNTIKTKRKKIWYVFFVKNITKQWHIILNSALVLVVKELMVKREKNLNNKRYVTSVENILKPEYHTERDVQKDVIHLEEENIYQQVFNLQIEDTPEYFANNILVHNCAIAWQMKDHATYSDIQTPEEKEELEREQKELSWEERLLPI